MGRALPYHDAGGQTTHPQRAAGIFLERVGNPANKPGKGWTIDFSWDLMVRFGMDPTNTPVETLLDYLGQHHLGYRIAINNGPYGAAASYWRSAVVNGMMPFAPQGNNDPKLRVPDPNAFRAAIAVAGGDLRNVTSYGPGMEFIDQITYEDSAQSWANQNVAAKFAHILDAHLEYNIWDARQHLRQTGAGWASGWNETNGYGRVNEKAEPGPLLPGAPVEFVAALSEDRHTVHFSWVNFAQSDFAATVIVRHNSQVLYDGTGTNFSWPSDLDGTETFRFWSRNKAGKISRPESNQARVVSGLSARAGQRCLVVCGLQNGCAEAIRCRENFRSAAPPWPCDVIALTKPGDKSSPSTAMRVVPGFSEAVDYAIANHYRILIPLSDNITNLIEQKSQWDRASDHNVLVVMPHHTSLSRSRNPRARRLETSSLISAVTVGFGITNNVLSFGPGLEFFDSPAGSNFADASQMQATAIIAAKLAHLLDRHPDYNIWDARQHLRQVSSYYNPGWREDGGFGRPDPKLPEIGRVEPAPPFDLRVERAGAGNTLIFRWRTFLESGYDKTIIKKMDGTTIFHGRGTEFKWTNSFPSAESLQFYSQDKDGTLSRPEKCARIAFP